MCTRHGWMKVGALWAALAQEFLQPVPIKALPDQGVQNLGLEELHAWPFLHCFWLLCKQGSGLMDTSFFERQGEYFAVRRASDFHALCVTKKMHFATWKVAAIIFRYAILLSLSLCLSLSVSLYLHTYIYIYVCMLYVCFLFLNLHVTLYLNKQKGGWWGVKARTL